MLKKVLRCRSIVIDYWVIRANFILLILSPVASAAISSSEQLAKAENEVDILSEQLAICKQKNRLGLG